MAAHDEDEEIDEVIFQAHIVYNTWVIVFKLALSTVIITR